MTESIVQFLRQPPPEFFGTLLVIGGCLWAGTTIWLLELKMKRMDEAPRCPRCGNGVDKSGTCTACGK